MTVLWLLWVASGPALVFAAIIWIRCAYFLAAQRSGDPSWSGGFVTDA